MYQSLDTSNITDNFNDEYRPGFTVDTSTVGSGSTVTAGTITAYASASVSQIGNATLAWVDFTPANRTSYVAADYNATTFTPLTNNVSIGAFTPAGSTITWTLNAAGLAAINKSGYTSFMLANNYTIYNESPAWGSLISNEASVYGYRYSNGTYTPYLSLNYTSTGGGAPSADFTSNVTACLAPCNVSFTDTSSNTPTNWTWAWADDGATFHSFDDPFNATPIQNFTTAGTYSIYHTAINDEGTGPIHKYDYLTVSNTWTSFTANATVGKPPLNVQFNDTSSSGPTNWDWYWGADETKSSDLQNPTATFSVVGAHPVRLYVSGGAAARMVE